MPTAKYSKQQFKDWILNRDLSRWQVSETPDAIALECDASKGEINFYPGEQGEDVVEMQITAKKDNGIRFYLHFELMDPAHAQELYEEMEKELAHVQEDKDLKVLLSCTSGATTLFFAEKLNQSAAALELPYAFDAVPYLELFEKAPDYDVILLAPQIGYLYQKLKTAIPDKLVLQFPTGAFARFDSMAAIDFIKEEVQSYCSAKEKNEPEKSAVATCSCCQKNKKSILSIAVIQDISHIKCAYQIVRDGAVILQECWILDHLEKQVYFDIIDRALCADRSIALIVLNLPGIVSPDRKTYRMPYESDPAKGIHLADQIRETYSIEAILINSANAAAKGFADAHPQYQNVTYCSQPYGLVNGGQGHWIHGHVVYGLQGIAGESTVYSSRLQYSNNPRRLAKTDTGQMELLINTLLPVIGVIGPDVLALRTPMVNDMRELRKNLTGFIDESFIPKLVYLDEQTATRFILEGGLSICMDLLKEKSDKKADKEKGGSKAS